MTRIEREKKVIREMVMIYCRSIHHTGKGEVCGPCEELIDYASKRLERCPKQNDKSSCRICEIHCYAPQRKEEIRAVMRYVGPRMIFYHPITAIRHLIDELR
ncbi:MAG: nitrous oxide-stimulated promoter family protein [Muribaculaceae bacterium]|nr:nitrous oxide-stimulated promoter family protein [Muribaculaceae bacterium]